MADFSFGDDVELQKLNAQVVSRRSSTLTRSEGSDTNMLCTHSWMSLKSSNTGTSWYAQQKRKKADSTGIPARRRSQRLEIPTTACWHGSRCFLGTGRNMPIWSLWSQGRKLRRW